MSLFGKLDSFDHESQEWSVYKYRLLGFFVANGIDETKDKDAVRRKAILISALTEGSYKLVRDLAFPDDVDKVEFSALTALLDRHFTPKRCEFADRWSFHQARQQAGEGLPEWAARVRGLALHCAFTALEETLRDKFVLGMLPGPERDKLFETSIDELTFAQAIELAQS